MRFTILTLEALADYLKLSPEIVLNQTHQGKFPGRKDDPALAEIRDKIYADRGRAEVDAELCPN